MFKNYLKIMLRSLIRTKTYSLLNILGLTIGITGATLILLWVEDELSYDDVYTNKDYIYNIPTSQNYNGKIYTFNATPGLLVPTIKDEIPGIDYATRLSRRVRLMRVEDKPIYKIGTYVDWNFFKMFDVQFVEGSLENLTNDINAIALTQKTAIQLLGTDKNIVGKSVVIDNNTPHVVGAVVKDLPQNVSVKYDWLGSLKSLESDNEDFKYWQSNVTSSYVQLAPNADVAKIDKLIQDILPQKTDNTKTYAFLDSMKNWHLYKYENGVMVDGQIFYVRLMSIIAIIILTIACINFMNLATARSAKRAGEVGIRKVLGSERKQLITQFIIEALILTSVAMLLSILLLNLILPYFNSMIGKELTVCLTNPFHILFLVVLVLCCGLLAGSYPAFYLSGFNPVVVLKGGRSKKGSAAFIRNGLVVLQFTVSIVLIIATIVIYSQIQYVKNRDVGFNKSNLVAIDLHGETAKHFKAIKKDMMDTRMLTDVGVISYNLMHNGWNGTGFDWEGKPEDFDPLISFRKIDANFIPTVGIEFVEGRNFRENPPQDGYSDGSSINSKVIITESLAQIMGNESAVGKILRRGDQPLEVIGVIKDIQYGSMYKKSMPMLFYNSPKSAQLLYARIDKNTPKNKALSTLEGVMKKYSPEFPFEYTFVEDTFNGKFKKEALFEKLSNWFAIITILISCLGLFGLAAYTAEQRNKEIGIRKVLGASISSVVNLLSKDFLKLVVLSIAIATPVAWLLMNNWLGNYSYHTTLSWWIFGLAAILAICIAMFTVSFQAIKAATANPVKSIEK